MQSKRINGIVVEVLVAMRAYKRQSIESWNEDFSVEGHLASIIKDHRSRQRLFC
jgi:hypothetical protein